MSDEVECPYCNETFDVNHDDGANYDDNKPSENQCPNCDKYVMVSASCSWSFEAEKADCLNGAAHPFTDWNTLWVGEKDMHMGEFYERRYCQDCGKEEMVWHRHRLGTNSPDRFGIAPTPTKEKTS